MSRSFTLGGAAFVGWNFSRPGPTLTVFEKENVTLRLFSDDLLIHAFWIDVNGNGMPSGAEPRSPDVFSDTTPTFYSFINNLSPGTYDYYCVYHPTTMFGRFVARILGDVDGDRDVDIIDASILAFAYGSTPGSSKWNPFADFNNNKVIDIVDASILAFNYGRIA